MPSRNFFVHKREDAAPFVRVLRMTSASFGLGKRAVIARKSIITAEEIPFGNWILWFETSFRTPTHGFDSPEERRARSLGSVIGRRGFKNVSDERQIEIVVTPYASQADARASLTNLPNRIFKVPLRREQETQRRTVNDAPVSGLDDALLYEIQVQASNNLYLIRLVGRVIGHQCVVMMFRAQEESWSWSDIANVANVQAQKVRALSSS